MPVLSSSHVVGHAQVDGRRYVRETHTLSAGAPEVAVEYLAPAEWTETEYVAVRDARVAALDEMLAASEYSLQLDEDRFSTLHLTGTQLAARFRAEYLDASRDRVCHMAYWLLRRITSGDITDAQARNAFGFTVTQWNNLKSTRLQPQHDAWAAVLAATGA